MKAQQFRGDLEFFFDRGNAPATEALRNGKIPSASFRDFIGGFAHDQHVVANPAIQPEDTQSIVGLVSCQVFAKAFAKKTAFACTAMHRFLQHWISALSGNARITNGLAGSSLVKLQAGLWGYVQKWLVAHGRGITAHTPSLLGVFGPWKRFAKGFANE